MSGFDREVRFLILEQVAVLTKHNTGWQKELNIVSWNGGQPKWDIRDWDPEHEYMSRGITLTESEMEAVRDSIGAREKGSKIELPGLAPKENEKKPAPAKKEKEPER